MDEKNAINDFMQAVIGDENIDDGYVNDDNEEAQGAQNNNNQDAQANDDKTPEVDYKALYEQTQKQIKENDNKYKVLEDELKALKNPKSNEEDKQKKEILESLGLGGLSEKLTLLDELVKKENQRSEQAKMDEKYRNLESELSKLYPNEDLKEFAQIGVKLAGLKDGDVESWKTLINIIKQGKSINAKTPDEYVNSKKGANVNDFNKKIESGSVDNIDLGKQLLSIM